MHIKKASCRYRSTMPEERERCVVAGMNDHIAKPIATEDLWKSLLKWIKPRHGSAAIEELQT